MLLVLTIKFIPLLTPHEAEMKHAVMYEAVDKSHAIQSIYPQNNPSKLPAVQTFASHHGLTSK
jgi:hypothetical protein